MVLVSSSCTNGPIFGHIEAVEALNHGAKQREQLPYAP